MVVYPSIYMPYESDCADSPVVNNTGGCVHFTACSVLFVDNSVQYCVDPCVDPWTVWLDCATFLFWSCDKHRPLLCRFRGSTIMPTSRRGSMRPSASARLSHHRLPSSLTPGTDTMQNPLLTHTLGSCSARKMQSSSFNFHSRCQG